MNDEPANNTVFLDRPYSNDDARLFIAIHGLELAVTCYRHNDFQDDSTAAKWEAAENAIVDLLEHLQIKTGA